VFLPEEDPMSLSLLTTALFSRLRVRARTLLPDSPPSQPESDSPRHRRERLRQDVLARGGTLAEIETIHGDCPAQTAQQIRDLTRWLERERVPSNTV
jgi:hypothetical protein